MGEDVVLASGVVELGERPVAGGGQLQAAAGHAGREPNSKS